ncbi:MAG: DUF1028 domain-containing protein [Hyphomicrobiaceae bacterium]
MTFSIVGRCGRTGMFGVAITTSSICVGARCPHVRAGVGAVATQNVTDPALGPMLLDLMARGVPAPDAVKAIVAGRAHIDYRQLTAVDAAGRVGHHTGGRILGTHAEVEGVDCMAAGNLLSSTAVPRAMAEAFAAHSGKHLGDRLLTALEAGQAAGGEEGPTHSAALLVADKQPFPLVDLRCDWDDEDPVKVLRRLLSDYTPQMQAYLDRAVNPTAAPSYGVPGDE